MTELNNEKKLATIFHVTPKGRDWQVKGVGNTRMTKSFYTQKEAIEYANELAKKRGGSVIIHRPDGKVRNGYSKKLAAKTTTKK